MLEGWNVVAEKGAGGASCVPGGIEHEVVDDKLALAGEEFGEGDSGLLAASSEGSEGVGFGDFDNGKGAALDSKGVTGAGDLLFLFEQSDAG